MSDATVRQWLLSHTPLEPSLLEGSGFAALVAERVGLMSAGDEPAYVESLDRRPDEVERLVAEIAVPETWLFRYPCSFELLVDVLRRRLAARAASVRMCAVGCATGQEPYSMAIAAAHAGWAPEQVRIDALDRNPEALRIAALGRYEAASIRSEIPGWAAEHFERESGAIWIDARVRGMVRFARVDITTSEIEGPCDVVFCRNVLIYLNAGARTRLIRGICAALAPGGVLFVGHAEQFLRGEPMLRPIAAPHAFAFERVAGAALSDEPPTRAPSVTARVVGPPRAALADARLISRPTGASPARAPARVAAVPHDEDALDEVRNLADAGRMAEGEELVRSIIARRGPSAAALELLGLIRIAADDQTRAKRLFEQAVYLDPARPACLLHLAMISERPGDPQRAATYWDRARRASVTAAQEPKP